MLKNQRKRVRSVTQKRSRGLSAAYIGVSAATSSRMKSVPQRDTGVERALRSALWQLGCRFRVNKRVGKTRPDIVFGRRRVAVFVDGCFWHGCPRHYLAPINNASLWHEKVTRNRLRDRRNTRELRVAGWRVIRIWECDIRRRIDVIALRVAGAVS